VRVANKARAALSFHWLSQWLEATLADEELSQSSAFGSDSCNLHSRFRGGQAELSEDR
jgi:hypothetical protein